MGRLVAVVLLSVGLVPAVSRADLVQVKDVVYRKVGNLDLTIRFYIPTDNATSRPAILWFHGGGWRGGTPKQFQRQSEYLASKGIVCGCVRYRLSGEAPFPACLNDCKNAVRYLRAHAKEFGVDPERIAVGGGSAGGHLAAMVGLTPGKFEGDGTFLDQPSHVSLMILFNPATDLRPLGEVATIKKLMNKSAPTDEELADASPVTHVTGKAPPALLLHGDKDTTVPHVHSAFLHRKLRQAGVAAELFTASGQQHSWFNRGQGYTQTLEVVEKFLTKHGYLK